MHKKVPARINASMEMTMKTTWVTKFISVFSVVTIRSFSLGMNTKMRMRMSGMRIPAAL